MEQTKLLLNHEITQLCIRSKCEFTGKETGASFIFIFKRSDALENLHFNATRLLQRLTNDL